MSGDLDLQDLADTPLPAVFETPQLARDVILRPPTLDG